MCYCGMNYAYKGCKCQTYRRKRRCRCHRSYYDYCSCSNRKLSHHNYCSYSKEKTSHHNYGHEHDYYTDPWLWLNPSQTKNDWNWYNCQSRRKKRCLCQCNSCQEKRRLRLDPCYVCYPRN